MRLAAILVLAVALVVAGPAAAASLTATMPAFERNTVPDSSGRVCGPSIVPLRDLNRLQLWGVKRYTVTKVLIADFDVRGLEGQPVQMVFNDQGEVWTVWLVTVDIHGNESCHSNHVGVNLGPGIPDPWMAAQCMCDS